LLTCGKWRDLAPVFGAMDDMTWHGPVECVTRGRERGNQAPNYVIAGIATVVEYVMGWRWL
jgi:hypothetical protein